MSGISQPHDGPRRPVLTPPTEKWLRKPWPALLLGLATLAVACWIFWSRLPAAEKGDDFLRSIIGVISDEAWLLLLAALAILVHAAVQAGGPFFRRPAAQKKVKLICLFSVLLLGMFLFINRAAATKTAVIGGVRTFWLDDDMMISMRYARNLAQGAGLVWNPGQPPVEGYTNFLWTLVMAVPHRLGLPDTKTSAAILGLNALLLPALLGVAWMAARRMGLPPAQRWLAVALVAANRWVLYWAVAGSETILLALLVLTVGYLGLAARRRRPLGWGAGVALGILGLVRADALVLSASLLAVWWGLSRRGRTRPWAWLPAVLIPLGHFLWRHAYYGAWFPNTYYLKVVDVPTRETYGVFYVSYFLTLFGGALALTLLAMAILRHPVARWLALAPLAAFAYSAYIGGDELGEYRFLAPVVPLLLVLAVAAGGEALRSGRLVRGVSPSLRFGWLVLLLALVAVRSLALPGELRKLGQGRGETEKNNVRIGLMLKRHTRPQALIAHFWAGAAPYFSARPALDVLGKSDKHIARLKASATDYQPGHNKYDPGYVFARRPDVVVAGIAGRIIQDPQAMAGDETRKNYPGLFLPLENPIFEKEYSKGLVGLPLSSQGHGIFIHQGSRWADPPDRWQPE